MSRHRLAGLDSTRGLAVLVVVLFHAGLLPYGWAGVDLFFGLSGFLITGILLDAQRSASSIGAFLTPFYARRALRILPLAWGTIAVVAVLTRQWKGPLLYSTYTANWAWTNSRVPPATLAHLWSLSVEEQFYLVWPLVVWCVRRNRLATTCLSLVGVCVMARAGLWLVAAPRNILGNSTIVRADPLLLGSWLAVLAADGRMPRPSVPIWAVSALAFLALDLPRVLRQREDIGWVYVVKPVVLAVAVLMTIRLALHSRRDWRPLARLGTVSYGVYIIHGLIHLPFRPWLTAPLLLASAWVSAEVTWMLLEQPVLRLKRFWPMPAGGALAPVRLPPPGRAIGSRPP